MFEILTIQSACRRNKSFYLKKKVPGLSDKKANWAASDRYRQKNSSYLAKVTLWYGNNTSPICPNSLLIFQYLALIVEQLHLRLDELF